MNISEIISKFNELGTAFVAMPVEYQVVAGIGGLVVIAAARNVWGMLKPVRWTVSTALRAVAFVFHPRKRTPRVSSRQPGVTLNESGNGFAITASTADEFYDLVAYYGGRHEKRRKALSYEQLCQLRDISDAVIEGVGGRADYLPKGMWKKYLPIKEERLRREEEQNVRQSLMQTQSSQISGAAPVGLRVVPFDFSTEEKAQAAYDFYAGTEVVQMLTPEQMDIISEAIDHFGLKKNSGLTAEKQRRETQSRVNSMGAKIAKMAGSPDMNKAAEAL